MHNFPFIRTLVLDGNLFSVLEQGSLTDVRVEFLSISHNQRLYRMERGAITSMPALQTLTMNNNPVLTYFDPGAISDARRLAALDLSRNALYALESTLPKHLPSLKALYLGGNRFKCHCGLGWLSSTSSRVLLRDESRIFCRPEDGRDAMLVTVRQMSQFEPECEPYILPLFPSEQQEMMGKNVSWLCKALGSEDLTLVWKLPGQRSSSSRELTNGECDGRACVNGNALTVRYLHPTVDSGRYSCVAKNKFGQDRRQVTLKVKVGTRAGACMFFPGERACSLMGDDY